VEFHKVWQEQCEATRTIRERFGVKSALDYLVGEKLLNFASEAERSLEFAAELPLSSRRVGYLQPI
jgi:phosphopantothenate synthetase